MSEPTIRYPREFCDRAKKLFPDNPALHQLIDAGGPSEFEQFLKREAYRTFSTTEMQDALDGKSHEELRKKLDHIRECDSLWIQLDEIIDRRGGERKRY